MSSRAIILDLLLPRILRDQYQFVDLWVQLRLDKTDWKTEYLYKIRLNHRTNTHAQFILEFLNLFSLFLSTTPPPFLT